MEVPLIAKPIVQHKKEKLEIWYNGKRKVISSPIKPYFYSYDATLIKSDDVEIKKIRAKALSSMQERTFYKYSFNTRQELVDNRVEGLTFEDNIPFIIRNRIDNPDLFTSYKNSKSLTFLFLDIEQYTKPEEMFPTYDDRIISIAWATNDRKVNCAYIRKDNTSDKLLLEKFISVYKDINPDVLVVFNKSYDIPTIIKRCERNRIDTLPLSKTNKKPVLTQKGVDIDGVLIYDVYDSAHEDQSLSGNVPNRGLKAVSDFFGFKAEREPLDTSQMHKYVGTPELVEYNKDDVYRTMYLFDVYWNNIEYNANDLKIPLNEAIDLSISNLGLLVIGDSFREQNIISDGKNSDRYPEIFKREKEQGESNYQGAIIDIYKTGLFNNIHKADYSSMYPTIMAEFNLSPDTTTLLGFREYSKSFKIEESELFTTYYIPDNVLNKTMVIQVVNNIKGFSASLVEKFLIERAKYKKKWKTTGEKLFRAISDNRKVKANGGVYGNQGFGAHAYGFAPIAVATTGIGRECAQLLIDLLNRLYPNSVIEVDTDGVYFNASVIDKEEIKKEFQKEIIKRFHKDLQLSIDIDDYKAGYFYRAKNYVLLTNKDDIIFHGAAIKARNKSRLKKNLIEELAKAKLEQKPTKPIIDKYLSLDFPIDYFAMNFRLGRPIRFYKNKGCLQVNIAEQGKALKIKPEIGTIYHYIKSNNGFILFENAKIEDIDRQYYINEIKTVADIFKVQVTEQKVDSWF